MERQGENSLMKFRHWYMFHAGLFQHIQWASSAFASYFSWLFAPVQREHTHIAEPAWHLLLHFQCCLLEPDHTPIEVNLFLNGITNIKSRGILGCKLWSTLEPLRAKFPRLLQSVNNLNCFISKKCLCIFLLPCPHHGQKWISQQGGREQSLVQHMCTKVWPYYCLKVPESPSPKSGNFYTIVT